MMPKNFPACVSCGAGGTLAPHRAKSNVSNWKPAVRPAAGEIASRGDVANRMFLPVLMPIYCSFKPPPIT